MRQCLQAPAHLRGCARQFDSIKRADYNFRAEQLDWQDKRMYVPRPNKHQFNERYDSSAHRLSLPPALSRTEFPSHSALISKVRPPAPCSSPSHPVRRAVCAALADAMGRRDRLRW